MCESLCKSFLHTIFKAFRKTKHKSLVKVLGWNKLMAVFGK